MSMASILIRARALHRVSYKKLTMISDNTLSLPSTISILTAKNGAMLFANDEGGCIIAAVDQYNMDMPNRRYLVAQGGSGIWQFYLDDLLAGWDNEVQVIEKILYPINVPEEISMNTNSWAQTKDPNNERPLLRFQTDRPTSSSYDAMYPSGRFAIVYLEPYVFDIATGVSEIRKNHEEAISQLAASLFLEMAATEASQFGDQQIFSNKDMKELGARLQLRADNCKKKYDELVDKDKFDKGPHWAGWYLDSPTGWRPFHPDNLYAG